MYPYFFVFFILVIFSFLEDKTKERIPTLVFFVCSVSILIAFAGFRELGVGSDDISYYNVFHKIPSLSNYIGGKFELSNVRMEYGYVIINIIVRSFTDDYTYLFLSVALLSVGIASYNYYKLSLFPIMSLLLFFVHTFLYRDMNQIRAAVAAAICLFSIVHITNRSSVKFYFVLLCASLFHLASLSMLLPYIVLKFNIDRKKALLCVSFSILLGSMSISSFILQYLPLLKSTITQSVINYSESEKYSSDLGLFNITNIKTLFIFLMLTIFYKKLQSKVSFFHVMYVLYMVSLCWRFAFNDFAIIAGRVATFFEIVEVILIPGFILLFNKRFFGKVIIVIYALLVLTLNTAVINRPPYDWVVF